MRNYGMKDACSYLSFFKRQKLLASIEIANSFLFSLYTMNRKEVAKRAHLFKIFSREPLLACKMEFSI